jgi:beta-lactamase class A
VLKRRTFAARGGAVLASMVAGGCARPLATGRQATDFNEAVRAIEQASGGRLGVAVRDTATGNEYAWRGDERFPLCSTFKLLLAGAVLARVDYGQERLERRIPIRASDLVPYAPRTQPRVGGAPMTVAELCEAAVTVSDNVAANVLLRTFGGPPALSGYLFTLGDWVTRLDRFEPELNEARPGDPRDTTSPRAMLRTMRKLVLGDTLKKSSREQLLDWLLGNEVGGAKLRAQLPAGWQVADKTGGGGHGTNNDVGVLFPPGKPPVLVTAYLTESAADQATRDGALAEVGRLVANLVG